MGAAAACWRAGAGCSLAGREAPKRPPVGAPAALRRLQCRQRLRHLHAPAACRLRLHVGCSPPSAAFQRRCFACRPAPTAAGRSSTPSGLPTCGTTFIQFGRTRRWRSATRVGPPCLQSLGGGGCGVGGVHLRSCGWACPRRRHPPAESGSATTCALFARVQCAPTATRRCSASWRRRGPLRFYLGPPCLFCCSAWSAGCSGCCCRGCSSRAAASCPHVLTPPCPPLWPPPCPPAPPPPPPPRSPARCARWCCRRGSSPRTRASTARWRTPHCLAWPPRCVFVPAVPWAVWLLLGNATLFGVAAQVGAAADLVCAASPVGWSLVHAPIMVHAELARGAHLLTRATPRAPPPAEGARQRPRAAHRPNHVLLRQPGAQAAARRRLHRPRLRAVRGGRRGGAGKGMRQS